MAPVSISLHGRASQEPPQAILVKLSDAMLREFREASSGSGSLQYLDGSVPKIHIGKRIIALTLKTEAFRHELYSASVDSVHDLHLSGLISHSGKLKVPEQKQSAGTDAALAALQSSLASYQREKQANSTNITSTLLPEPKSRFDAARKQKQDARRGLLSSQNGLGLSNDSKHERGGPAAPTSAEQFAARQHAMRTPIIHLLAMGPMSRWQVSQKTHIPKDELDELLKRVGKQVDGQWQLTERAFKELDVWTFRYKSQDDRQAAIDNAIRAYDRLRLGKDEKLWQMLLPEHERDKGKILSRLHLAAAAAHSLLSPNPGRDAGGDAKLASAANTPRLGPSSTPKIGASKAENGAALSKRLFSKDPKKARAAEDAKGKKRKEREAAAAVASDRESTVKPARKRQTTKANNPKIKSAELVHSSSDESGEAGEVKATPRMPVKAAGNGLSTGALKPVPKATTTAKSPTSDTAVKPKASAVRTAATAAKATPTSAPLRASAKATASRSSLNGASANSSQPRTQLSSQKPGNKPKVPSPLGAARPRVASDVSDRGRVGVQRVRQEAEAPRGLGITNGVRKRQDTVTSSTESITSNGSEMAKTREVKAAASADRTQKSSTNGASHAAPELANGKSSNGISNGSTSVKRKVPESRDAAPAAKHRRTESTPVQASSKLHSAAAAAAAAAAASSSSPANGHHSSLDALFSNSSNGGGHARSHSNGYDSSTTILSNITYAQGVSLAQRFRDDLYPQYARLYDEQAAKEERGEKVPRAERDKLWAMHRRLEEIKMQLKAASQREHLDD